MSDDGGEFRSAYQGLGTFEQSAARRRRKRIAVAAVAAVALLGAAGTTYVVLDDDTAGVAAPRTPATTTAQPTTTTTQPTTTTTQPTTTTESPTGGQVDAVTPGWQGVLSAKDSAAYDVPPDWQVEHHGTVRGFEVDGEVRTFMRGIAVFKPDVCPEMTASSRAFVGFMYPDTPTDPTKAAETAAETWAEAAAELPEGSSQVSASNPKDVEINDGELTAKMSAAEVDTPDDADCAAPRGRATAVAFDNDHSDDTPVFVMYTDVGVDDELSTGIADRVIASLRPHRDSS